jgi:hypothetical protein
VLSLGRLLGGVFGTDPTRGGMGGAEAVEDRKGEEEGVTWGRKEVVFECDADGVFVACKGCVVTFGLEKDDGLSEVMPYLSTSFGEAEFDVFSMSPPPPFSETDFLFSDMILKA